MELFVQSCESVLKELGSLKVGTEQQPFSVPQTDEFLQKLASEEYDSSFIKQIHQIWRIFAWIPFVHILYLAGGVLKELKDSALYILLVLFYFSHLNPFRQGNLR